MLENYKRKGWIGISIFLLAIFAVFFLVAGLSASGSAPGYASILAGLTGLTGLAALASWFYAVICFAKGKGYSALYGVSLIVVPMLLAAALLPKNYASGFAFLVSIAGLVFLPDKNPLVQSTQAAGRPTWRDNVGVAWRMLTDWLSPKS